MRRYGAAVIVMAFDETGQADTFARKTEICARSYDRILVDEVGFRRKTSSSTRTFSPSPPASKNTPCNGVDFINATGGSSRTCRTRNFRRRVQRSFSFRGNNKVRAIHAVFLYHAIAAGMTMGIVNAGALEVYEEVQPICAKHRDVVLNRTPRRRCYRTDPDCTGGKIQGDATQAQTEDLSWRQASCRSASPTRW